VIFFARYEASQYGSQTIETEHLLLGLLREDLDVLKGLLIPSAISLPQVRDEIERHMERRKSLSTSIEVPLSIESKRVLNHAAEEADRLGHKHIGTEHLLLGLLRGENSRASVILRHYGADAATIRSKVAEGLLLQWAPGRRAGGAIAALNSFLSSLKNRCNPELADFFAVNGQFVDTSGKCGSDGKKSRPQLRDCSRALCKKEYDLPRREYLFGAPRSGAGLGPVVERGAHGSRAQVRIANDHSFGSSGGRVEHLSRASGACDSITPAGVNPNSRIERASPCRLLYLPGLVLGINTHVIHQHLLRKVRRRVRIARPDSSDGDI